MPRPLLISFLGKGRRLSGASGYEPARYRFPDGWTAETSFFGWAAWRWLRRVTPNVRWLIIGTGGSTWDQLLELAPDDGGGEAQAALVTWCEHAQALVGNEPALVAHCASFPAVAGRRVGVDATLAVTDLEPRSLLRILDEVLERGDRVTLDMTHGFRHLPAVATMCLNTLRWSKAIEVDGFLYGALEMRDAGGTTPVLDLSSVRDIERAATPLAVLSLTGRYGDLAELVAPNDIDAIRAIREADLLESLNQLGRAQASINTLRKRIGNVSEDPMRDAIRRLLLDATAWSGDKSEVGRLIARAKRAIAIDNCAQALVLSVEAVKLAILRCEPDAIDQDYASTDKRVRDRAFDIARSWSKSLESDLRRIFALRNACAHGDLSLAGERPVPVNTDREALAGLIGRVLAFASDLTRA